VNVDRGTVSLGTVEFECGRSVPLGVAYETYGEFTGENAVLVCHALTGSHHVATGGDASAIGADGQADAWWDGIVGPGQAIDTTGQIASLNTEGRDTVTLGIDASQGDATYRIDASHDGTNWIEGFATYDPAVGDSTDTVRDSLSIGASHIRVFVSGASGTAGATADVLLGASG